MREIVDYFFEKLKEFAKWAKEYFKKTNPPVEVVPFPPKPADPPVVTPPKPVDPVVSPGPLPADTSQNVMSVATNSLHFNRQVENAQEMTFAVIGNGRPVYFKVMPSPRYGLPTYQKEEEIRLWVTDESGQVVADAPYAGGVQNQLSYPPFVGTHYLHAVTKGFSGWVIFQAVYA